MTSLVFLIMPAISALAARDVIECQREKNRTRQFCSVSSEVFVLDIALDTTPEPLWADYDFLSPLETKKVALQSANGLEYLWLPGLNPIIEFELDWTNTEGCRRSDLWMDQVALFLMNDQDESLHISNLYPGLNLVRFDLDSVAHSPFIKRMIDGESFSEKVSFSVINLSHYDARPLASQRIDRECGLFLKTTRIGFDPLKINQDIQVLEILVKKTLASLNQNRILHTTITSQQANLACWLTKLGQLIGETELSFQGRQTISGFIKEAIDQGALDYSPRSQNGREFEGFYQYFLSLKEESELSNLCQKELDVDKSIDSYIGVNDSRSSELLIINAQDFKRNKENLRQLVNATIALVRAGGIDLETNKKLKWVFDPLLMMSLIERSE